MLVAVVWVVVRPWFDDPSTYGFHDWDVVTSYRYLVKVSLLEHHQFPGWNPYACGGYPSWGYVEGATNLVSPWLPAYLVLPLPWAIRVEVVGMGLLGAFGAYALGACFTKSHGARLLVAALWAVNGRWGLQTASGHAWHLAYAYLPWCLYFFERARGRTRRLRFLVMLAVCLALLVYGGGIYPLPHTVLILGCYAVLCSLQGRTVRPLWVLALGGLLALGLSAPKLLPILDTFAVDPRLIPSNERLSLGAFVTLLTDPDQRFYSRPAKVHPYGWHEWGMYISSAGVALLALGVVFVEGRRERAFKAIGLLLLVLGFGAFHKAAPWTLLHAHVPVFKSQHVPARFLYPAVLMLSVVTAAGLGRLIERRRRHFPWLDLALVAAVSLVGFDVARVARKPMKDAMWMVPPDIPADRPFHYSVNPPYQYKKRDWAGPMLLSMMANTGVLNCYGVPRAKGWKWAAAARGKRGYRGEAYVASGSPAEIVRFSPNEVIVRSPEVADGDLLVLNMHHRAGWHAEVSASATGRADLQVQAHRRLIAARVPAGAQEVTFWYRPPGLWTGLGLAGCTIGLLTFVWWRRRQEHRPGEVSDS